MFLLAALVFYTSLGITKLTPDTRNDMGFVWMHYECKLFIPKLLLSPHLAYQSISIGQPLCCLYSWKVVYRIYFHFISTKCWMVIHGDVRTKSNKYIHSFLTFRGECICQKPDMWTWTCVHGGDCVISSIFMECHFHMWIRRFTRHPCPVRNYIGSEIDNKYGQWMFSIYEIISALNWNIYSV